MISRRRYEWLAFVTGAHLSLVAHFVCQMFAKPTCCLPLPGSGTSLSLTWYLSALPLHHCPCRSIARLDLHAIEHTITPIE